MLRLWLRDDPAGEWEEVTRFVRCDDMAPNVVGLAAAVDFFELVRPRVSVVTWRDERREREYKLDQAPV